MSSANLIRFGGLAAMIAGLLLWSTFWDWFCWCWFSGLVSNQSVTVNSLVS
jgi:hypothetical protein